MNPNLHHVATTSTMGESAASKMTEGSSLMGSPDRVKGSRLRRCWKSTTATVYSFVPILDWLPSYSIRDNLAADIVGGFTVGSMHVPQGIAYASLAGVRPVIGLYTSLLAPFIYMFFGTSRHISLGVFAVVSLMCGACNVRVTDEYFASRASNYTEEELGEAKLDYALHVLSGLGFTAGLIQIAMGLLRLDFLVSFLSDQVVTGFMVGAAFHVFVAQLDKILGASLPRRGGIGKFYMSLTDVIRAMLTMKINPYTTSLSIVAIMILFTLKTFVDPFVQRVMPLPVPYDLMLLLVGTVLSTVFDFHGVFGMKVIGTIPTGLPSFTPPDLSVVPHVVGDAAQIAIVILVVSISMGKLCAKKHKYEINVRQEFYALGMVEVLGSFFPTWPSSTALARTLVYEGAGTKTQFATVFSSSMLVAVLIFVGPLLELLPVCLLSCVIVVALKGMFMKLACIPTLWRVSKIDAVIFVLTLFATISLNPIEGLACGAAVSIVHVLLASKRGAFNAQELQGENCEKREVKMLKYEGSLYFMNSEDFASKVRAHADSIKNESIPSIEGTVGNHCEMKEESARMLPTLLVDLSALRFIDYSGSAVLLSMAESLEKDHIRLCYIAAPCDILPTIRQLPDWSRFESHFYAWLDDVMEKNV